MDNKTTGKPKRLFSSLALACLLISAPLARSAASRLAQGQAMVGYGGLSLVISAMVALLLSGLILGQIALFRGEKPRVFPAAVLILNAAAFLFLVIHMPR